VELSNLVQYAKDFKGPERSPCGRFDGWCGPEESSTTAEEGMLALIVMYF
jgi:hypothetical protein